MREASRVDALFAERATTRADAPAVIDGDVTVTYRELAQAQAAVATLLTGAGVRPGEPVGLSLRRGRGVIAAILGIWRHGCAYVPLDLDHPPARRQAVIDDVGLRCLIEEDDSGFVVRTVDTSQNGPRVLPPGTAYVMFTSGSTGAPKGVVVRHENLLSLFDATASVFDFGPDDVWSQFHSHTFDFSVWEMWGPLLTGGVCVIVPPEVVADAARLAEFLVANRVSVLDLVPSVFRLLVDVLAGAGPLLPALRYAILGGEAVAADVVARWFDSGQAVHSLLYNMYGITEITVHATVKLLDESERTTVSIGRPLPNAKIELVDAGRPVPPGVAGEIFVAGGGVAAGYLDREELTAQRFVEAELDGIRRTWYRSGDYAVRRADGDLVYLGRRDDQVKIRGIRIELDEIERRLTDHPAVGEAFVLPVDTGDGLEPVALVTAAEGPRPERPSDSALRDWVREHLPQVFVPRSIVWLDTVPLSPNGKADRRELLAIAEERWRLVSADGDRAATDDLGTLWRRLLPDAPDSEGFLSLGGNSLLAVRLTAQLRELGVVVAPSTLIRDNASLARLREIAAGGVPDRALQPVPPPTAPTAPTSPLAPEQRRLWLMDRINPEPAAYNVIGALRVRGDLDLDLVRTALAAVVDRRDALRARLVEDEPGWHYEPTADLVLDVVQAEGELSDDQVMRFAREIGARPISLEKPPLLTAAILVAADAKDHCLVVSMHHIVSDLVSLDLVFRDFAQVCSSGLGETTAEPAPSFAEYARRAAATVAGPQWNEDLAYWRQLLADAPAEVRLPFRTRMAGPPSTRGNTRQTALGVDLTARIDELLRDRAATSAMFFIAATATVLSAWAAQPTVVLGMPAVRRRSTTDTELVGFLLSTLPVRVDVGDCPDFGALLDHVRSRCAEALDHDTPSFDAVVDALAIPTNPGQNPVFNIWVNDVSGAGGDLTVAGAEARLVHLPVTNALFELGLYLHRDTDGYRLEIVNAADRVPDFVADEVLAQCVLVVEQVTGRVDTPLSELSLVTPRAGAAGAVLDAPVPEAESHAEVVEQFAATARARPADVAIVSGEWRLTYESLAGRVAELARRLTHVGAGAGDLVEIRTSRSAHLPVVLLAVWQVGAVAALVDAALPELRADTCATLLGARWMLRLPPDEDAAVPVVTQRQVGRRLPGASHVLFTSGSGGRPAAVVAAGATLAGTLGAYLRAFPMTGDDRVALLAGAGHDPVLRDVLTPLLSGGVLVVPPVGLLGDPTALARFLTRQGSTVLHTTPALLELVVTAAEQHGTSLTALRRVVSGGGPLPAGLVERLRRLTTASVVNAYGTTETPQIATWTELADDLAGQRVVPVSATTGTAALVVMTPDGTPAGIGQRGEVVVRSRQLASGYLDADAGRAASFVSDPAGAPGVRAFRTSDLGRLDPFGMIHLDGRLDRQVQINGGRVELAEIEAAALRCPGVGQAAAGLVDTALGEVLCLHVVPAGDARPEPDGVRGQLRRFLPAYAVPAQVHVVSALRTNANHKVVVEPVRLRERTTVAKHGVPAPDGTVLAAILNELGAVLDRAVRPEENFFEAGLNSISLLRLQERLQRVLGRRFQAAALFAHPNARLLAAFLLANAGSTAERRGARPSRVAVRDMRQVRRDIRARMRAGGAG